MSTICDLVNDAVEVRIVFDERQYLDDVCLSAVGTLITGYSIIEHETTYIW